MMNPEEGHAQQDASPEVILREAERIFASELERIASRFSMKGEHLEDMLQNTGFKLGRDGIAQYKEKKRECEEGVRALSSSFLGKVCRAFASLTGRRENYEDIIQKYREAADTYGGLIESCSARSFAYSQEKREIVIYPLGERSLHEDKRDFARGILAEMGHAVIGSIEPHREGGFQLDKAVGEVYDIAFQLYGLFEDRNRGSDALEMFIQGFITDMVLADAYQEFMKRCESIEEAAHQVVTQFHAQMASEPDLDTLFQAVRDRFQRYATDVKEHADGVALTYDLIRRMSIETGLSLEEMLPGLMAVAMAALYDPAVDFSSPEGFLKSVERRLPDYLA